MSSDFTKLRNSLQAIVSEVYDVETRNLTPAAKDKLYKNRYAKLHKLVKSLRLKKS